MADKYEPGHFFHGLPSFRFEEFLDKVLDKLYSMNPEITKDLRRVLRKGNSFDIFEALWNLEEAHQELALPERLVSDDVDSEKSMEQSLNYLRLGDLRRHDSKDIALQHYNMSIIFAPHPPIHIGDKIFGAIPEGINEKHGGLDSEGWGYYPSLARGCKARADLLFEMHQYPGCIQDINFVQRLGCPEEERSYLQYMRAHCYQMMSKPESAGVETFASFTVTNVKLPVLEDPNPHLPAASSAVSVAYDDRGLNRHLKTNRNVKQGNNFVAFITSIVKVLSLGMLYKYTVVFNISVARLQDF